MPVVSRRTPCPGAVQECPIILFSNADAGKTVEVLRENAMDMVKVDDRKLPVQWINRNKHANGSATIASVDNNVPSSVVTLEDGTRFRVPGKRYKFIKAHLESGLVNWPSKYLSKVHRNQNL